MKRPARIILNILSVVLVLGFIALCIWRMMYESSGSLTIVLWIVCAVLSEMTSGLFHECGHALFGLFSGVHAKLSKNSSFSLFKPLSVAVIPKTDKNLKSRMIITSFGGIAVNLIFVIVGILAVAVPQIPIWLSGIALSNIIVFLDNVFPFEYKSGKTDGLIISELIKNEPSAQVMLAVLTVHAHILNGKPIEELDKKLIFDLPQIREDDHAFISLTDIRARYCEAVGDTENAEKYKSRLEQLKEDYLN